MNQGQFSNHNPPHKFNTPKKLEDISFLIHGESLNLSQSTKKKELKLESDQILQHQQHYYHLQIQNLEMANEIEFLQQEMEKRNVEIKVYQELIKSNQNFKEIQMENIELKKSLQNLREQLNELILQKNQIYDENIILKEKVFNKIDKQEEIREL